jgi:glycosyltransferase involved in cell wall biosynthesis
MRLSVITSTWNRPLELRNCITQYQKQSRNDTEHIVVSDGPCDANKAICDGLNYHELPEHMGNGNYAKDLGIEVARGEYVCFWDDDNKFCDCAIEQSLAATRNNNDICLVQIWDNKYRRMLLPEFDEFPGYFEFGKIDTGCLIVKRSYAIQEKWSEYERAGDWKWISKIFIRTQDVFFHKSLIGVHV